MITSDGKQEKHENIFGTALSGRQERSDSIGNIGQNEANVQVTFDEECWCYVEQEILERYHKIFINSRYGGLSKAKCTFHEEEYNGQKPNKCECLYYRKEGSYFRDYNREPCPDSPAPTTVSPTAHPTVSPTSSPTTVSPTTASPSLPGLPGDYHDDDNRCGDTILNDIVGAGQNQYHKLTLTSRQRVTIHDCKSAMEDPKLVIFKGTEDVSTNKGCAKNLEVTQEDGDDCGQEVCQRDYNRNNALGEHFTVTLEAGEYRIRMSPYGNTNGGSYQIHIACQPV